MPGLVDTEAASRKRRRDVESSNNQKKARKAAKSSVLEDASGDAILLLETQILSGNQHLNNIVTLQGFISNREADQASALLAAVSLCRVFCRLIADERFSSRRSESEANTQIAQWLQQRLVDYVGSVVDWIGSPDAKEENTAVTLLMRIVKEEGSQDSARADSAWRSDRSAFYKTVEALVERSSAEGARETFVEKYMDVYPDVRHFTMLAISKVAVSSQNWHNSIQNALEILLQIENIPENSLDGETWFGKLPHEASKLLSLAAHRKAAQECWLSVFRGPLSIAQRKMMLSAMNSHILPWFTTRMERLTDFLTDSFNAGGALSLLALSGLFHLMTERNLDYPDFYSKLYSLLDDDLLHSTHRSRFFKLLDKFLGSSHLPAALVASFIKRLSRLALQAPPGAIVWIFPWTYNMLRAHRSCTFMLHRPHHMAHAIYANNHNYKEDGLVDPFSMSEMDPMLTCAIDSSLWELHTLQSHWHPNVATLARILSDQFTKRDYVLDDFLHHTYATLIEAELRKDIKKKPEVEWEIPKRILTTEAGNESINELGLLLEAAIDS